MEARLHRRIDRVMRVPLRALALLLAFSPLLAFVPLATPAVSADDPPSGQIPITGPNTVIGTHDPTLFKDGNTYYASATNGGLRRATSLGGPWESIGTVSKAPWTNAVSGGALWAPHVRKVGDTFYMYYAQSNFGSNNSAIGVKTTQTPGIAASWVDHGSPIITSGVQNPNPALATYNAIDPAIHQDENGDWWIVWGSHFSGIQIQRLEDDMVTTTGPITLLAHRGSAQFPVPQPNFNRLEGPVIFKRGGYYYLITAWDWCCRNGNGLSPADNTYKVVIGRSTSITGPYVDKNGIPLAQGGGSIILNSRTANAGVTPAGLYRAPGGVDIFIENGVYYVIYHAYLPQTRMAIRPMDWHGDWPFFYESNGGPYDLRDGAHYRLINQDGIITNPNSLQNPVASNRCLTATAAGDTTNVIQATCNGSLEQIWQLHKELDGFYRLRSMLGDQSLCLEMADASGTVGTDVALKPCRDSDNTLQFWYFDDTGHGFHRPVAKQANLALEIENTDGVIATNVVGGYRRDGNHQAGNLTQAAKWPPQQWQFSMVTLTDEQSVALDLAALKIGFGAGDSAGSVTQNLTLPTSGPHGTTIAWASSDEATIDPDTGAVQRPLFSASDAEVTLTATVAKGAASATRAFVLTVKAIDIVQLIDQLAASGDVTGPLVPQLSNKARQAEHHYDGGRDKQAIKFLEDLLKAVDNPALQQYVSDEAKQIIRAEVQALIGALSE
jgi:hypothetical protein